MLKKLFSIVLSWHMPTNRKPRDYGYIAIRKDPDIDYTRCNGTFFNTIAEAKDFWDNELSNNEREEWAMFTLFPMRG